MVIDTDILSKGISLNKILISNIESIATPAIPTSSDTIGLSESYPLWVAKSKAIDKPIWPASRFLL